MKFRDIITEPMLGVIQDENVSVIVDRCGNYEVVSDRETSNFLKSLNGADKKRVVLSKWVDIDKDGEYPVIWVNLTDRLDRGTVSINIAIKADNLSYGALADREISDFITSPDIMNMITAYFNDDIYIDTMTIGEFISKEDITRVLRNQLPMVNRAVDGYVLTEEETELYFERYYSDEDMLYANEDKVIRFWKTKGNELVLAFIDGTGYYSVIKVQLTIGNIQDDYTKILQQSFSDYIKDKAMMDWIKTYKCNC